jgi:hypothetical protein
MADIGLIRVNSSTLKAMLLPNPEAMITNIRELLPLLMMEDATQLVTKFSSISQEMSVVPHDVEEFVTKMKSLQHAEIVVPGLLKGR